MNPPPAPDSRRLAALYQEHADGLAGAVRGILGGAADVDEVLQESFLRAWRALRGGTSPRDAVAWIFVVTLNVARDQRRRRQRRGPRISLDEDCAMNLSSPAVDPSGGIERHEALEAAKHAIAALEPKHQEVFLLRVSGGLSFDAIADSLGIPLGTAKTRMRTALRELRRGLAPHAPAGPRIGERT